MSSFEIISDYSKANLTEIPERIMEMKNLKMLFLERNLLIKLPDDFFFKLPSLMWLDLRNNQLEELPKSIAHHGYLEHLLLTNNNIRKLPNELGLVSNLKALQVADNPLVYPPKKVIQDGTKSIKNFLKEEYEKEWSKNAEKQRKVIEAQDEIKNQLLERKQFMEMQEEKLIKVHEKNSKVASLNEISKVSKEILNSAPKPSRSRESTVASNRTIELVQNKLSDPNNLLPTLHVKKIEHPSAKKSEQLKIVHKVSKSDSKIALKSYFDKTGIKNNLERIPENVLKEGWLNKLRILLNDQERILQQERNLKALSSWRLKKPSLTRTTDSENSTRRSAETPYATYPEYSRIPSRGELASQLQAFLREPEFTTDPVQTPQINIDKVINDLVEQLKEMERDNDETRTPRSEMFHSGKQIEKIVDIHKKLLQLKSTNDFL